MPMVDGNGNGSKQGARLMRIGDLARQAGTTMRTIRYYEERGLLTPTTRTKGGFRLYREGELKKLHLIRSLQQLDIPLAQVKLLFDRKIEGKSGAEVAPGLQDALRGQLTALEEQIRRCHLLQDSIRQSLALLDRCAECPREPGIEACQPCPVIATLERVPLHLQAIIEAAGGGRPAEAAGARQHVTSIATEGGELA
jgi:DNA-binding transcriptional MerR regulator